MSARHPSPEGIRAAIARGHVEMERLLAAHQERRAKERNDINLMTKIVQRAIELGCVKEEKYVDAIIVLIQLSRFQQLNLPRLLEWEDEFFRCYWFENVSNYKLRLTD